MAPKNEEGKNDGMKKGGPRNPDSAASDGTTGFGGERDLVTFYSRLTQTLENVCGRERLARLLAGVRNRVAEPDYSPEFAAALARTLRRMDVVGPGGDAVPAIGEFIRDMAYAVSRPEHQVALLLRLFVLGDGEDGARPVCGATPQCAPCLLSRECRQFNCPPRPEMAVLSPAARLLAGNARAVSDAELLALLLAGEKATGREPQVEVLLARYGRLLAVVGADAHEFLGMRDMTRSQALRLAAVAELYRRLLVDRRDEFLHISGSKDLYDRYAPELRASPTEVAVLVVLDAQNRVVRDVWFQGQSPDSSHVSVRDLLRPALREHAVRIALVHNHPGADPSPSLSDIDFTRQLRMAADITGLGLVDHVIVAERGYYSFAEEGMLGL